MRWFSRRQWSSAVPRQTPIRSFQHSAKTTPPRSHGRRRWSRSCEGTAGSSRPRPSIRRIGSVTSGTARTTTTPRNEATMASTMTTRGGTAARRRGGRAGRWPAPTPRGRSRCTMFTAVAAAAAGRTTRRSGRTGSWATAAASTGSRTRPPGRSSPRARPTPPSACGSPPAVTRRVRAQAHSDTPHVILDLNS